MILSWLLKRMTIFSPFFGLDPPGRFGFSKKKFINHLLKPSANRDGQGPLDELYKEVLEGYLADQEAKVLFRTVVGQLLTAIEPLTIRSLTTLRQLPPTTMTTTTVMPLLRCSVALARC